MAVIVLAIGVIMAIAGGCEIFYGSGYIDIERGWSAFISGTVLLTGGLMTVALGFALRSLADLKTTLLRLGSSPVPFAPASVAPPPAAPEVSLPRREAPVPLRSAEPTLALDPAGAPGRALQIEPYFDGVERAPSGEGERLPPLVLAEQAVEPASFAAPAEGPHPTAEAAFAQMPPQQALPQQRPPPPTAPQPAVAQPAPDASPAMDDWLDRNFADLDREMAELHAREAESFERPAQGPERGSAHELLAAEVPQDQRLPEPARAAVGEPTRVDPVVHQVARELEPAAKAEAPPRAEPAPAVIGRYEADGTSYVMYADGSIEAQSEAGIYRFASMAELKAFIET